MSQAGTAQRTTQREPLGADPRQARLYGALSALRDAGPEPRRTMHAEWRHIHEWLRRQAGRRQGALEACQFALFRVMRGIDALRADTPAAATAWLRLVLRTGFHDFYRDAKNEPVALGLAALSPKARDRALGRLKAPEAERELCPTMLDEWLEATMDRVDDWLDAHVRCPRRRVGARRRAEVALLRHVRGTGLDELRALLGEPVARDTLYKWFERGRDGVLVPALEAWAASANLPEQEVDFVGALHGILIASRREKSRKPRKVRDVLKARPVVSRDAGVTSVQVMLTMNDGTDTPEPEPTP